MPKLKSNIKNLKSILLALMILFAFAPCSIKASVLKPIDISYATKLNQTKTTIHFSQCQDLNAISHAKTSLEIVKNFDFHPILFQLNYGFPNFNLQKVSNNDSEIAKSNSPPKYILFKRLKINLA